MDVITEIRRKAAARKKTIVLPEYTDKRVVEGARILKEEGIAEIILLTPDRIEKDRKERYIEEFYEQFKAKDVTPESARALFEDTLYYAAMLARDGGADGLVAGAAHTTADMVRAAIRCIGMDERFMLISSCFIMCVPDSPYGVEGTFIFADCGVIPDPNARQLACIAVCAAELAEKLLSMPPRVAFLSYSTKGSAKTRSAEKIAEALAALKEMSPALLADGELQVDAAIDPEVAKIKYPQGPLGGRANVLIFPNLEAGNIGYKLTQRLANARAVGPLLLGSKRPASDLSRGCIADDVVDCAAATALRA